MLSTTFVYRIIFHATSIIVLLLVLDSNAQLLNLSNGENSLYFTNPAAAGMNRRLSVNLVHHKYWTSPLAPQSSGLAFHLPLHFERYGIGAVVFQENSSTSELLKIEGDFSTKIILGRGYVSYGVRLGMSQVVSKLSEEKIKNPDDPLSTWRTIRPNTAMGILYKTKKCFIGLDFQLNNGLYKAKLSSYKSLVDVFAGATLKTGSWEYQPVLAILCTRKMDVMWQSTHSLLWKRFLGVSVGGKSPGMFCPGLLLNALPFTGRDMQIRYTFEKMLRKNSLNYDQGHEIQIRFLFRKSASVESIKKMRTTPSPMDFQ